MQFRSMLVRELQSFLMGRRSIHSQASSKSNRKTRHRRDLHGFQVPQIRRAIIKGVNCRFATFGSTCTEAMLRDVTYLSAYICGAKSSFTC